MEDWFQAYMDSEECPCFKPTLLNLFPEADTIKRAAATAELRTLLCEGELALFMAYHRRRVFILAFTMQQHVSAFYFCCWFQSFVYSS